MVPSDYLFRTYLTADHAAKNDRMTSKKLTQENVQEIVLT
jgi:hypothetical protein